MTIAQLASALGAETICGGDASRDITAGYSSDLLSDVMAHCPEDSVLVTIQNHVNTVAVSTLTGAAAILICHAREIPEDMRAAATKEQVAILRTDKNQFDAVRAVARALGLA